MLNGLNIMQLIKVGFVIDARWIGGLNYYRNLLFAISYIPDRKIEPVILLGQKTSDKILSGLPDFQVIRTSILDRYSLAWFLNKILWKLLGRNILLNRLLIKNDVQVLSHTLPDKSKRIKTIGWIPDFQHVHLPSMFSNLELNVRDKQFTKIAKFCDSVIVSSQDAYKDFSHFAPRYIKKVRVLNFVSAPSTIDLPSLETLKAKYGFNRPYFYLPNQFWKHKNHSLMIDAINDLKNEWPDVLVLASGSEQDYRDLCYFSNLVSQVNEYGISSNFVSLGIVPYSDVVSLMINSMAVINPSLFEGWSSTVEEAKSLGVALILSDINVHREQADGKASFFPPSSASCLAKKLREFKSDKKITEVHLSSKYTLENNNQRLKNYGCAYQDIILELIYNPCHLYQAK